MPFDDKDDPHNGEAYHTGKPCIEAGCDNPAGTAWSPFWCFECNTARLKRLGEALAEIENNENK